MTDYFGYQCFLQLTMNAFLSKFRLLIPIVTIDLLLPQGQVAKRCLNFTYITAAKTNVRGMRMAKRIIPPAVRPVQSSFFI